MDADIKARWVEALRSGRYVQGYSRLVTRKEGVRHCCLGVLCEVVQGPEYFTDAPARCLKLQPPDDVLQRAGPKYRDVSELMILNDVDGKTFTEIADHIGANL